MHILHESYMQLQWMRLVTLQATVEKWAIFRDIVGPPAPALVLLLLVTAVQDAVQVHQAQPIHNIRQHRVVGCNFRNSRLKRKLKMYPFKYFQINVYKFM